MVFECWHPNAHSFYAVSLKSYYVCQGGILGVHINHIQAHTGTHAHIHTHSRSKAMQINPLPEPGYPINVPDLVISALAKSMSDD